MRPEHCQQVVDHVDGFKMERRGLVLADDETQMRRF
jgi:hypothetical protein